MDYRKFYSEEDSRHYAFEKKQSKNVEELRLIDQAMRLLAPCHTILDIPCGGGRVMVHLLQGGYQVTGADVSQAMVDLTRETLASLNLSGPVECQDLEKLTYEDQQFEVVICFRLFHHLPTQDLRERMIGELCRVSSHYVLLSYFSPYSYTSINRSIRVKMGLKQAHQWPTSLKTLNNMFATCQFQLVQDFARFPIFHTLHLAVWKRRTA